MNAKKNIDERRDVRTALMAEGVVEVTGDEADRIAGGFLLISGMYLVYMNAQPSPHFGG